MTKEEFFKYQQEVFAKLAAQSRKKNSDYCGTGDDPFANFSRVELLGICTTEQGFLTRMNDKFSRLISFSQKGFLEVSEETVEDTLHDLAAYCVLFSGYLISKKDEQSVNPFSPFVSPAVKNPPLNLRG